MQSLKKFATRAGRIRELPSYEELISSIDPEVKWLFRAHTGGYSGESIYVGQKVRCMKGEFVFVSNTWGSCALCDVLQGCNDLADLEALRQSLADAFIWFASLAEMLKWAEGRDWETQICEPALVKKLRQWLRREATPRIS